MLDTKKEEEVRGMITNFKTNSEITAASGLPLATVKRVRSTMARMLQISENAVERIVAMLIGGYSVGAICVFLKISEDAVTAVKRFYYLKTEKHNKKRRVPLCDICKDSLVPDWRSIHSDYNATLLSIVEDVVSLDRLNLINSPLFFGIAKRARSSLARYRNGK